MKLPPTNPPHIHTYDDCRGSRTVMLNGKEVDYVVYADEKRGIVKVLDYPFKADKYKKRLIHRTRRGCVEVFMK